MTATLQPENTTAMTTPAMHHLEEPEITRHLRHLPDGSQIEILSSPDATHGFSAPRFVEDDGRDFIRMIDGLVCAYQSVADEAGFDGHVEWKLPSGRTLILQFSHQEPITATIR